MILHRNIDVLQKDCLGAKIGSRHLGDRLSEVLISCDTVFGRRTLWVERLVSWCYLANRHPTLK